MSLYDLYKWHKVWLTVGGKVRFPGRPAAIMAIKQARADFAAGRTRILYPLWKH